MKMCFTFFWSGEKKTTIEHAQQKEAYHRDYITWSPYEEV